MELQFQKTTCPCLEPVVREVQTCEQTLEMRLPDGMPDIGHIISAWGQVITRSKEWRTDSIAYSGGIMVWILYAPEDGSTMRCIDGWIPFQMNWDLPSGTPEGTMRIYCLLRFVDARSVSARKIMTRAGVSALAEAYAPKAVEVFAPDANTDGVELLRNTYPMRMPQEAGESTLTVDEELELPASVPGLANLIYYQLNPSVTEKKILGNKIVYRGNGNLHILYTSEDGVLHTWDFDLPFSQYAQLNGDYGPDAQADVLMAVTGMELEPTETGKLRVKVGMAGQYLIEDRQTVELVEDAYSPGREVTTQTQPLQLPVILDNRRENIYGEQMIPGDANSTADVRFLPDFPMQRRTENAVEAEIPGTFQVLYYGPDGTLHSATARWTTQQRWNADEDSDLMIIPGQPIPQVSTGTGQMAARVELPVDMTANGSQQLPMITGVELGQSVAPDAGRPSLILRRAGEGSLWDIAKANNTTVEAIRRANGLTEAPAPNRMLLIPIA